MNLRDLGMQLSADMRGDKPAPPPDVFDREKYPFGVPAGTNKFGSMECATCGKPATKMEGTFGNRPDAFLFRDTLSVREYRISGMCQACQDDVFNVNED